MRCAIAICEVGPKMVVEMKLIEDGKVRHSAWKSEEKAELLDVLATLPDIARHLRRKEGVTT